MLRRGERAPTHHARDHNTVKTGRVQGEQLVLEFPKPINLAAECLLAEPKDRKRVLGVVLYLHLCEPGLWEQMAFTPS
jgi:hypothetical protein